MMDFRPAPPRRVQHFTRRGSDHIGAARFGPFGDVLSITAVRTA
jgi:hypothetical protein